MPLPDEKPQSVEETDQEPEQTHVDALNLSLRHDFSDVFVKLSSGDLSLTVQRNLSGEIWSTHPGIRPDEALDQPFGVCWRSGVTAHVKMTFKTLNNPPPACRAKRPEPDYTFVTDENGSSYRFVLMWKDGGPYFLPVPSNRTDQETFLMTLEVLNPTDPMPDWNLRFVRKFGTTLDFVATNLQQSYQTNPGEETPDYQYFYYFRLSQVYDRMGNRLTYMGDEDSLIPTSIVGKSGTGTTRAIQITQVDNRITSITDPRGSTTYYYYSTVTVNGHPVERLVQVSRPEGCYVRYGYEMVTEYDDTPQEPPEEDNYFFHANVNSIEDALGNVYQIAYAFDESRESLTSVSGSSVWYVAPGQPRIVQRVVLPDENEALFAQVLTAPLRVLYQWNGTESVPTINGNRINEVTDAAGHVRRYTYSVPKFVSTKQFEDLFFNGTAGKPRIEFFLILWEKLVLRHPTLVTETCEFDGDSGMMLKKLTDYSGNITTFEYSDTWSVADALPWLPVALQNHPYFFTKWPDVTAQVNALTGRKEFTYYSNNPLSPVARIMVGIVDEEERVTEYEIDTATGLRTAEIIMDAELNVVRRTEFSYENVTFPMFMTEKRVIDGVLTSTGLENLVTVYTPDAYGNVEEEETGGLTSMTYEHDLNGNKTASIDGRSNRTEMEYDGVNRLFLVTLPDASIKFIGWDARSKKIREDDENGNITRYEYDTLNRLIKTTREMPGADNLVTEFTYNAVGSKLTQKDPNGNVTEFEYDAIQRLVLTRDALNNETVLEYGANSGSTAFDTSGFKPTQATDARGFRVINTYDDLYRLVETQAEYETDEFAVTVNEYDGVGNLIKVTDPLLSVTETEYDALNRSVKVINPDLTEVLTEYTAGDRLLTSDLDEKAKEEPKAKFVIIKVTDELARETTFEYDLAGRQVLIRQPDPVTGLPSANSPETVNEYDATNNLTATINPLGKQWDYTYDVRNRRTEELQPEVPDGEQSGAPMERPLIVTAYDYVGNVTSVTDPRGNTTTTEYDAANRQIKMTQPAVPVYGSGSPVVPETETGYDLNGNVLTVTDAEGNVTENTYDALNRLTLTRTWPEAGVHSIEVGYEYDQVGNRTAQTDGRNCRVEFQYDGLKRLTRTRHDAGTAKQADVVEEYDELLKVARVDATGRRTEYAYDVRHRLTGVVYISQTVDNRELAYDDVGNLLSVTHPNDPGSVRNTANTYDKLNRALTETSAGVTHSYEYDKAGNRTHVEYGGTGRTIDSEYDALNRLQEMDEEASGGGSTRTTAYLRDLSGNLVSKTLPNGTVEKRTHDALNRPEEIETIIPGTPDVVLLHQEYGYDTVGNVRHIAESYPGGTLPDRDIVNEYDGTYRLLEEEITTAGMGVVTTNYAYDDGNNRTSKVVVGGPDAGTTTYVIGTGANGAGANQIKQLTLPGPVTVDYTYDLNGNRLTRDDGTQDDASTYDYEQRLVQLVRTGGSGAGTYLYAYDARTRRVTRDESGASGADAKVVFSGGTSVQEYDLGGPTLVVEYVRGHDWGGGVGGILYSIRSGTESYAHASARGDVVSKTDDTGAITWEAQYEAFGKHPDEAGTNADRQRANSKDEDPTGLLNEGFRYRDLETGTFITRDPAGFVDGPNLYTYVRQNPWTKWDPQGLQENKPKDAKKEAKPQKRAVPKPPKSAKKSAIFVTNPQMYDEDVEDVMTELPKNGSPGTYVRERLQDRRVTKLIADLNEQDAKGEKYLSDGDYLHPTPFIAQSEAELTEVARNFDYVVYAAHGGLVTSSSGASTEFKIDVPRDGMIVQRSPYLIFTKPKGIVEINTCGGDACAPGMGLRPTDPKNSQGGSMGQLNKMAVNHVMEFLKD